MMKKSLVTILIFLITLVLLSSSVFAWCGFKDYKCCGCFATNCNLNDNTGCPKYEAYGYCCWGDVCCDYYNPSTKTCFYAHSDPKPNTIPDPSKCPNYWKNNDPSTLVCYYHTDYKCTAAGWDCVYSSMTCSEYEVSGDWCLWGPICQGGTNCLFFSHGDTCTCSGCSDHCISGTTCYYGGCTKNGPSYTSCSLCSGNKTADCTSSGCQNYRCIKGSCGAQCGSDSDCPAGYKCDSDCTCKVAQASITISSSPQGSGFVSVDGVAITTPQTYSWTPGSTHTLSASSTVQPQPALKYVYSSWSDGGAQTHTITVPSSSTTYTAYFKPQIYLSVVANPSAGGSVSGSGWYDVGTTATISATANSGYTFSSWTANWGGGYSGTANPATVSIDPKAQAFASKGNTPTETANFAAQVCTHYSPSVWVSPDSQTTSNPGTTLSYTVSVTNQDSGCGPSTFILSVTTCPSGFTCTLSKSSVTIPAGTTDSSTTISITSPSTAAPNTYTFTVMATHSEDPNLWGEAGATYVISGTCSYSLSINPSSGTYSDTTNTWSISATDNSNSYCSSPITYTITYSTSGSCDSSNTYVSPTSFSINRGSTKNNAFSVKVTRSGSSCTLSLSVKDPNGNVVATGSYTVSQGTYTATFSQSGIPSGTTWGVTVGGTRYTSTTSSVSVSGLSGTVSYTYDSTVPGASGTQYICSSGCSGSVSSATTVTANYVTQYQLTMAVNPAGSGTTSPAIGSYWYNSGTSVSISATANTGYTFSSWTGTGTGSYTGTSPSATITMNSPITQTANFYVQITIDSSPQGSGFVSVDGVAITTPQTYSWTPGSTHTLSASSTVQLQPALKYVYSSWSDGGAQSHTITVPSSSTTYTAYFKPQIYLSVVANPSAGGSVSGSGWYDVGTTATISATANTCYIFSNWTANWGGGYNGTANPATVSIDAKAQAFASKGNTPTETANFGYNNGASCGTQHCSNSAIHTTGDDCTGDWCDYRHYGQCSSGSCVYLSENCDNYDNNDCRCRISNPNLIDECKDYECVPLLGNTCAWTGDWLTVKTYTCDSSKVDSTQLCRGTTYYCCYDNGYKWQTTPCGTCSYSLSINPSSGTYSDTTNTWGISATDRSNSYCSSTITYTITYSTSGSCDSSNTYVNPTSFSISRGSTFNAFIVKVTRTGNSCTLSLSVKDPNGNVVATGSYTVSQAAPTTYTLNVNSAVDILGTALAGVQIAVDGTSKSTDSSGKTAFSLSTGSHTITAQASFNGRPFSHFWDHDANADCNQNDPYDTANNPYSFTMNACTRDITAWYKVFTHFQNSAGTQGAIDYDGTTISGYLLREDNQPLHYSGGATVSLEYYDGSWHSIGTTTASSSNGYFSYSWSCVPGATQIRASFTDSSWYYTSSTGTKTVSCGGCSGTLSVQTSGSGTCTVTASLTASNCDGKTWQIRDDGNVKCSGTISGNSYSYTCPSWSVSSGTYTYNLYIDGGLKDSKSVTCTAVADTTKPTAQITSPPDNSWQRTNFNADLLYQDDTQLQTCYYRVRKRQVGGLWNSPSWSSVACSGSDTYSTALQITVGSTGYCNYQSTDGITTTCRAEVYAKDAAGNVGPTPPAAREWRIDYTAPTGDININPPAPTSADKVTYTATGSDAESGLSQIRIYVDGGLQKTCSSSPCSWTSPTNYTAGSTHTYSAVIYDIAGNSYTVSKTFTVNAVCNNNGICEVYALNIGENQTGCPHDCYTVAYFTPSQNLLPGQEVAVTVYFNDSRWDSSRDASLNLTIDGKEWTNCQVQNKKWTSLGWQHQNSWSSSDGKIRITSQLGYAKLETNCTLPTWLTSGTHYFVATPTLYSKPVTLTPATSKFTVGTASIKPVSSFNLFLQFLKSLVGILFLE